MTSPVDFSDLGAKPAEGQTPPQPMDFSDLGGKPAEDHGMSTALGGIVKDLGTGAVKSALQVPVTISKGLNKIPVVGETLAPKQGVEAADQATQLHGTGEQVGAGLESIAEFVLGEGAAASALKGAAKLKQMASVVSFLERYPRIAKIVGTAMRQGTVGTAQDLAHGATPEEALKTGAAVGITGGAVEGVQGGLKSALGKETARVEAGKAVEKATATHEAAAAEHAAAKEGLADTREAVTAAKGNVKEAQAAGKQSAEKAEDARMAASQKAAGEGVKEAAAKVKPGAQSFGDAAEMLRDEARPVYEKINQATNGDFNKLMAERNAARRAKQFDKYHELNGKMDQMFAERVGAVSGDEMAAARENWRHSKVLDDVHDAVESSFTLPEDVANRTGATRELRGKAMQSKLNRLLMGERSQVEEVLGKEGVDNLYRMAQLTSPQKAKLSKEAAENVAKALAEQEKAMNAAAYAERDVKFAAGKAEPAKAALDKSKAEAAKLAPSHKMIPIVGLTTHAMAGRAGVGAAIGAGAAVATGHSPYQGALLGVAAGAGAQQVIHAAAVNPAVGKLFSYAVENGVNPKVYAPLIAATIRGTRQEPQPTMQSSH